MSKVILKFSLDTDNPFDNEIIEKLKSLPENNRKDYLVSAVLYYMRSPAYTLQCRMENLSKQIETVSTSLVPQQSIQIDTDGLLKEFEKRNQQFIETLLSQLKNGKVTLEDHKRSVKVEINDGAKDTFKKIGDEFF